MIMLAILAPLALIAQGPPPPANPADEALVTFEALDLEQAAALRCAVGFALVSAWQTDGDARGAAYPALAEEEAREFFVQTMAQLMDDLELGRPGMLDLVALQQVRFDERPALLGEIMPACLLMKRAAGL